MISPSLPPGMKPGGTLSFAADFVRIRMRSGKCKKEEGQAAMLCRRSVENRFGKRMPSERIPMRPTVRFSLIILMLAPALFTVGCATTAKTAKIAGASPDLLGSLQIGQTTRQ